MAQIYNLQILIPNNAIISNNIFPYILGNSQMIQLLESNILPFNPTVNSYMNSFISAELFEIGNNTINTTINSTSMNVSFIYVSNSTGNNISMNTSTLSITDSSNNKIFANSTEIILSSNTSNLIITSTDTYSITVNSNNAIVIPVGTTAQRPGGANGAIRYNSDVQAVEFSENGLWTAPSLKQYFLQLSGNGALNGTYYFTGYTQSNGTILNAVAFTTPSGTANVAIQIGSNNVTFNGSAANLSVTTGTNSAINAIANNTFNIGSVISAIVYNSTINSSANGTLLIMVNYK